MDHLGSVKRIDILFGGRRVSSISGQISRLWSVDEWLKGIGEVMTHRCILLERRAHALIGKNVEGDIYIYNVTGIETLCIECNIVI